MIALIVLAAAIALVLFAIRLCSRKNGNDQTNGSHTIKKKNTFSHSHNISKLPQVKSVKDKFGLGGSGTSIITISLSKVPRLYIVLYYY